MSLSEKLKTKLKVGNWIFDDVGVSYRNQLDKKVNSHKLNKNISELCLAHYQRLNLAETILNSSTQGLFDLNLSAPALNAIQNILSQEHPGKSVRLREDPACRAGPRIGVGSPGISRCLRKD